MDQYLAQKMSPMQPMLVYGRSAKAAPTCPPDQCLWFGWRDPTNEKASIHVSLLCHRVISMYTCFLHTYAFGPMLGPHSAIHGRQPPTA